MSRYDLRFSVGVDETSASSFKTRLEELTAKRKIPIGFDYKEMNLFKKSLTQGFDTTVRFHADIDELKRAVSQFNIRDVSEPFTVDSFISQQTLDLSEKRIQKLVSSFERLEQQKAKVIESADTLRTLSNRRYLGNFDRETDKYTTSTEAFKPKEDTKRLRQARQELQNETAAYLEQHRKTLILLNSLEADPKMADALKKLKPAQRSTQGFMNYFGKSGKVKVDKESNTKIYAESISDIVANVTEFNNSLSSTPFDKLDALQKTFRSLRSEVRGFIKDNNISINSKGVIKGISELSTDKLTEVNEIIQRMQELNKLIVSAGGNKQTLGASGNKAENQLFGALRTELENRVENIQRVSGILNMESEKVKTNVSSQAVTKLRDDFTNGLNNVPINSFAINPEALEALREAIQAQLQNITIGKTITLTPNSTDEETHEKVVLPNVVIGSIELSADAVTKLREDTQRVLNNVTLEPAADETAFTQAFERVSKTYQNKLNTIGRKINKAIQAPVIEEFDATPAIEKLKAQINEALKSFKFDINGRVAHGTISTGLDEQYQFAYRTYESLEKGVGKLTSGANKNIEKLTGMGATAGASDVLAKYNELLSKINSFKEAFRAVDAEGKLTMPIEEANKQMAELLAESHKLEDSFNNVSTRYSIDKTLDNTAKNIQNVVQSMGKYQDSEEMQNIKSGFVGADGTGGLIAQINALKASLPNKSISEANAEMMELLTRTEQLSQEFQTIGANTPLVSELQRAESEATTLERKILSLQGKMQKALTANSRGFAHPEYRTRFDELYRATQTDNLSGEEIRVLDTRFQQLIRDMQEAGMTGKSFGDIMRGMYAKFGSWTMVTMTIQRVIMTFKRMVAAVKEVDSALTNLRKVTSATESDLNRFMSSVGDSAYRMGSSISDLINATAEFSRLGYDLNQAKKLGELATMYKTVAEGLDITTASQSIVSTLKAFEKSGITAERIVDVFNYVGNNFAISSAGIGEAMQRSAASLQTANNSLEQSVALITAA